ncbi:fungal-specific transcription factor domain-containing protein [Aspergillus unguis]
MTDAAKQDATKGLDEAAEYLAHHAGHEPLSPEEERKMIRKTDWILLPMLFMTATLGAVDKVAISTAAIYGLEDDLHLVGQQYSWAGSILSIGVRCLEAIIVPSISLIIAAFYTKTEQPPRNALVFAAASSIINGFLSWAVGHIPSSAPMAIWQYLFFITGSISALWSMIAFLFLPSSPMTAVFLTPREKHHTLQRLSANKTGITNRHWKWTQSLEAIVDPKTWLLFLFNIAINIPNGGLTTFSGIIINNLGFSAVHTSLLNMPTGVMSTASAFLFSWVAAKCVNRRCLVTMVACCVPAVGAVMVYTLPRENIAGQMVGIYLLYTYFAPYVVGISLAQANTAGSTKKTVQYSILYIGYAVGNLIGPQTFRDSQAPAYTGGFVAMLVCYCVCILLMGMYWGIAAVMNRRDEPVGEEEDAFADKTDFEQVGFRETRRRTGCHQCKEKHIQCTEEYPRCRRCEGLDLHCVRGIKLTFREDALQRGLSFGREGLWTKRPSKTSQTRAPFRAVPLDTYIDNWIFVNTTTNDISSKPDPSLDLELPVSYHPLHSFPQSESYLLDYFIRGISPSCSLSSSHNPYTSLIIPLCFTSNTLLHTLLAVAANQLYLLGHEHFQQSACFYKDKALTGLRQRMEERVYDEQTIATVLMLCFQDISDGCSPSWITHLRGGLQLIRDNAFDNQSSPGLRAFFRMYFVAHDIMSRTASGIEAEDENENANLWSETDDLDEIDMLMGCSRRLMSIIHKISVLACRKIKGPTQGYATAQLRHALHTLQQRLLTHADPNPHLEQIANIKRLAALLYLHERLNPPKPPRETEYRSLSVTKSDLITSIIHSVSTLPNTASTATLLWPLFILGTSCLNETQRRFVLDRLLDIQRARNLGSVRRTVDAVKYIFGTGSLGLRKGGWGCESWRFISLA